jgi:protein-S-isoprenylcysteine O-methyltransferase Ste14
MIVYAITAFLGIHLFVIFYEERTLKKKFGAAYEDYCKSVPRWPCRIKIHGLPEH